jgi:hypothetical protein
MPYFNSTAIRRAEYDEQTMRLSYGFPMTTTTFAESHCTYGKDF